MEIIEKEVTIKFTNDDLVGLKQDMDSYEDINDKPYLDELFQLVSRFLDQNR